jgi:hypothetical protein
MPMADLFKEILPSIMQTKEYALLTDADERSYPAFMVNRGLSYHRDTVLLANEMNRFSNLDNKLKYDFLLNIVRAQKRPYNKWYKKAASTDLEAIKEYYGYSDAKALEALKVLSVDQIAMVKEQLYKGD